MRAKSPSRKKWELDIALGFSDTLAGLRSEPIKFDQSRKPEALREIYREKIQRAKASMCLIVRDREHCIRPCIESPLDLFYEIIVLDTGSKDRTMEIIKEDPQVKLFQAPWEQNFALARNQVQSYATGNFIAWMDSDDLMPILTAFQMTDLALSCPPNVGGYYAEVRFKEKPGDSSVRVDYYYQALSQPPADSMEQVGFTNKYWFRYWEAGFRNPWPTDMYVVHEFYGMTSRLGRKRNYERDEPIPMLDLEGTPW